MAKAALKGREIESYRFNFLIFCLPESLSVGMKKNLMVISLRTLQGYTDLVLTVKSGSSRSRFFIRIFPCFNGVIRVDSNQRQGRRQLMRNIRKGTGNTSISASPPERMALHALLRIMSRLLIPVAIIIHYSQHSPPMETSWHSSQCRHILSVREEKNYLLVMKEFCLQCGYSLQARLNRPTTNVVEKSWSFSFQTPGCI